MYTALMDDLDSTYSQTPTRVLSSISATGWLRTPSRQSSAILRKVGMWTVSLTSEAFCSDLTAKLSQGSCLSYCARTLDVTVSWITRKHSQESVAMVTSSPGAKLTVILVRSEERRVGKEGRCEREWCG